MNEPYTRSEVVGLGDVDPPRGPLCHHCGLRIPQFLDLTDTARARVLDLICSNQRIMAMRELQAQTGCSLRWAKLWVVHSGRPLSRRPGPPCPFCGAPLKTSRARLCLHCGRDWHADAALDPDRDPIPINPTASCYPRDDRDNDKGSDIA